MGKGREGRGRGEYTPNDSLGTVHLHTVSRDFAQRLYLNVATPVRAPNAAAIP